MHVRPVCAHVAWKCSSAAQATRARWATHVVCAIGVLLPGSPLTTNEGIALSPHDASLSPVRLRTDELPWARLWIRRSSRRRTWTPLQLRRRLRRCRCRARPLPARPYRPRLGLSVLFIDTHHGCPFASPSLGPLATRARRRPRSPAKQQPDASPAAPARRAGLFLPAAPSCRGTVAARPSRPRAQPPPSVTRSQAARSPPEPLSALVMPAPRTASSSVIPRW